jgi:hypothetical protein
MSEARKVPKVESEIETPLVPNFLRTKGGRLVPVTEIPDGVLWDLAVAWGTALVASAKRQRDTGSSGVAL